MNKIYLLGAACAGTVVSSAITYIFMKKKIEEKQKDCDSQIESVKAVFANHCKDCYYRLNYDLEEEKHVMKEMKDQSSEIIKKYAGEEEIKTKVKETKKEAESMSESISKRPYRISEDEYGEIIEYAQKSLDYYEGDHIIIDEWDNILTDVEDIIGYDVLYNFPQDEDVIYIRNDELGADYEITRYEESYKDFYGD